MASCGRAPRLRVETTEFSLRTDDPKVAKERRKASIEKLIAGYYYGDDRRTFAGTLEAWGPWLANQVGGETEQRYLVSIGRLSRFFEGKALDEINGKLIAEIILARQSVD